MKVKNKTVIAPELNTTPTEVEDNDVDFDMSEYIQAEADKKAEQELVNKPLEVNEVEDLNTSEDVFDSLGYTETALKEAELKELKDSAVLQKVDQVMSAMDNVVIKQAGVLEKNADQLQMMTESVSKAVESQSQMVSSIAKAIDAKFDMQNQTTKQLVDNRVEEAITAPYLEVSDIVQKRKRKERIRSLVVLALVGVVIFFCLRNEHIRLRVSIIANDIKDIAVGIYNGENVSSNQLIKDLGIHINDVNTKYFDDNGNEITAEEYYKLMH